MVSRNTLPSMEATMFAMRDKGQGRNMMRNIIIGQGAGMLANTVLDAFEPSQRKTDDQKDSTNKTLNRYLIIKKTMKR